MGRFDGRVAVVTGAARGIGFGTATRFAEEGASVAVIDLDESAAAAAAGKLPLGEAAKAIGIGCDVSDGASVDAAVARVVEELGGIHILVNNAGITRDNLLFKMTEEDWDLVMGVHLKGAFLMTRACQAHMTAEKYGRVVNLSSSSAQGNRGQANYSAAKAGLQGFTKTLAIELGKFGVTANAVAPGFIQTDMTRATAERIGVPFDDFIAHTAQQIPVARVGQPEDIAATIAFLVSQEAGFVQTDMTAATATRLGVSFEDFIEHSARQIPVQRVGQPEDIAATIAFLVSEEAGFVSGQVIYVAGGPLD